MGCVMGFVSKADRPGGKLWQTADKYLMPVEFSTVRFA